MTLNPLPAGPYQVGPLSLGRAGVPRDVFCPCRFDYILAWSREEVGKKISKDPGEHKLRGRAKEGRETWVGLENGAKAAGKNADDK